jgi:membrane-associated HD superfamily phosphohydrolase
MTREELLTLVNKEVDTTKFKELSQKTINEELDDVLEDFGDDEEANSKLVTKLANRLKRINGNLHKNISDEVKKSKEEAERKKKEEEEERKRREADKGDDPDNKYNELLKEIKALKEANAERDKKAARKATIESVKAGLKDKFDKANLEMNDFFLDTALSKLEISDDADVAELVSTAENIYTADYKRANGGNAVPRKGSSAPSGEEKKLDEHEWDDIKDICKDRATKATVKK